MNSKTLVCAYGKGGEIENVFERLHAMYRLNYSKSYVYCALIDLDGACLYRTAGDESIEEKAYNAVKRLTERYGERFFCGIRQRRCVSVKGERYYICEDGAIGALKSLWRYVGGKAEELFPCFGTLGDGGFERVYFSSETDGLTEEKTVCGLNEYKVTAKGLFKKRQALEGKAELSASNGFVNVIEPSGIFSLGQGLKNENAVFASSGYPHVPVTHYEAHGGRVTSSALICEGVFGAYALDMLLSEGVRICDLICKIEKSVGICRLPIKTLGECQKSANKK